MSNYPVQVSREGGDRSRLVLRAASASRLEFELVIVGGETLRRVVVPVERGRPIFPHWRNEGGESLGSDIADEAVRLRAAEELVRLDAAEELVRLDAAAAAVRAGRRRAA
jgi:hypothetical protein